MEIRISRTHSSKSSHLQNVSTARLKFRCITIQHERINDRKSKVVKFLIKTGVSISLITFKFKAGPFIYKQHTHELKIRTFSQTSIFYLICHSSVILIAILCLERRMPTSELCCKKKVAQNGPEPATFELLTFRFPN